MLQDFWPNSRLAKKGNLSIPFGMLQHALRVRVIRRYATFNSFWDATERYGVEVESYLRRPFNSFWDAT